MRKRKTEQTTGPDVEIRNRNKPHQSIRDRYLDLEELRPTGETSHIPDEKVNDGFEGDPRRQRVATSSGGYPDAPTVTDGECPSCGAPVPDGQTKCRFCLTNHLGSDATSTNEPESTTFLGIVHLVVESTTFYGAVAKGGAAANLLSANEAEPAVDDAQASAEFQEWLDIQSRFHDYSYRNTLLIKRQCPEATRVAGYRTWQEEFDRHVQKGESALWIWAPIITKRCPECENSPSYHEDSDCSYDETPSEEWSEGLVGFKPAPVFDVSQTEGEPLPDLDTEASGDAGDLVEQLTVAADELGVTARIVSEAEWTHGEAKGICEQLSLVDVQPLVEARDRKNDADLSRTLIHEYAHALLHFDIDDETEQSKREVEAEAVAYVVGRYCGLDTSGSAFYLAAWKSDDPEFVHDRLDRISSTVEELIEVLEEGA